MPTHQQKQNRNHDNNQKSQAQNQVDKGEQAREGDMRQANQRNQDQERTRKDAPRRDEGHNR